MLDFYHKYIYLIKNGENETVVETNLAFYVFLLIPYVWLLLFLDLIISIDN